MIDANLIKMYEQSFRDNREMSAVTDYFSGESYSYYGFAKEIAKLHILFDEAGIKRGDKIALVGSNISVWDNLQHRFMIQFPNHHTITSRFQMNLP